MNSIKSIFTFLMLVFLTNTIVAQDLKQFIPKDAYFVVEVNTKRMNSKFDLDKIKQYDFMKMLEEEMQGSESNTAAFFKDPKAAGIKENSSYFMYGTKKGEATNYGMLMEIADKSKYADAVKQIEEMLS